MMEAVLSNADHPEYGVATIPLPIPRNQYDHCVALLEALEIGDASEADCRLDSLDSAWPVLNQLVCTKVNLDELDYLCALPGFVDSKNEEKTERNAGYLVVSQSGGGMLRQGTREGIRRTPANRGMRAHRIVKGLDISEDVCHGMCP